MNPLIDKLDTLLKRLSQSGIERTAGLYKTMGTDCFYYKKSLDLFERNDYDDIKFLLLACLKEIEIIDGKTNE